MRDGICSSRRLIGPGYCCLRRNHMVWRVVNYFQPPRRASVPFADERNFSGSPTKKKKNASAMEKEFILAWFYGGDKLIASVIQTNLDNRRQVFRYFPDKNTFLSVHCVSTELKISDVSTVKILQIKCSNLRKWLSNLLHCQMYQENPSQNSFQSGKGSIHVAGSTKTTWSLSGTIEFHVNNK